jgi:1-deoxyxylulose-5-phosphate synthase
VPPQAYFVLSADFDVQGAVRVVARNRGVPPASIALAWLIGQPGVVAPIVGATREQHLNDAVSAGTIRLDGDEKAALEGPYLPRLTTDYT